MEKQRAVIYARFSSHNQREESIEGQLRVCNGYAVEHNIQVIREYTDSALSGRTDKRPAFQRMIADSAKKEFDTVLVYAHDRFARNRYDAATYRTKLENNGVRLQAVTMPLDDSPESGLIESVMEGFAQYYSENLARATKRGMEENALKGLSNGPKPLGYKSEDGKIVIDPVGAQAVKLIFERYTEGIGKKKICDELNENGYRTSHGKAFCVNGLRPILENERYTGVYIFGDHRIEGGIPAIISQEMFHKAQIQAESRKRTKGVTKAVEDYLLSGKVFCGLCGEPLVGESGTSSTGTTHHYYKCSARKKDKDSCTLKPIRKEALENEVIRYIRDDILTEDYIQEISTKAYALLEDDLADKSLLQSLQAEHQAVSDKINNILDALENGIYTSKTKDRLLELEEQQQELADKIVIEKLKKPEFTKDHVIYWLSSFKDGTISDPHYKRSMINSLVNSVFVYPDKEKGDNYFRVVIALSIKNASARPLKRSDVQHMGRLTRFERAHHGATIRCVNRFTTTAIY